MAHSVKKFEPLPMPAGNSMVQISLVGVTDIGGHPYLVYRKQQPDQMNRWRDTICLEPFEETKP